MLIYSFKWELNPCFLPGFAKYLVRSKVEEVQHRNTICFMGRICAWEERSESISQFNSVNFVNAECKDVRRHLHSTVFLFNQNYSWTGLDNYSICIFWWKNCFLKCLSILKPLNLQSKQSCVKGFLNCDKKLHMIFHTDINMTLWLIKLVI